MASSNTRQLLECAICLTEKVGKTPRSLSCLHSFCHDCLVTLFDSNGTRNNTGGLLKCPVCRRVTRIQGGIKRLPIDFRLQDMANLINQTQDSCQCRPCQQKGISTLAKSACLTCSSLYCDKCSVEHKNVALFSDHKMVNAFCKQHGKPFGYICETCMAGICSDCITSGAHASHVHKKVDCGRRLVTAKISATITKMNSATQNLEQYINMKKEESEAKRPRFEEKVKLQGEIMKANIDRMVKETIRKHKQTESASVGRLFQVYQEACDKTTEIGAAAALLRMDSGDFLANLHSVDARLQTEMNKIETLGKSLPDPSLHSHIGCSLRMFGRRTASQAKCCVDGVPLELGSARLKKILDLDCSVTLPEQLNPFWISVNSDGAAVVSSREGNVVHKISTTGFASKIYEGNRVCGTCVDHEDNIYIAQDNGCAVVKRISFGRSVILKLNSALQRISDIKVKGNDLFLSSGGGIFTRSLSGPGGEEVLNLPSSHYFTITENPLSEVKFIVTTWNTHEVRFYDTNGNEVNKMGEHSGRELNFSAPMGITQLVNGHFLVADYHNSRIVEFLIDGSFVRNLLTRDNGLRFPTGIAYLHPYLWVCESNSSENLRKIKLFKFVNPPSQARQQHASK